MLQQLEESTTQTHTLNFSLYLPFPPLSFSFSIYPSFTHTLEFPCVQQLKELCSYKVPRLASSFSFTFSFSFDFLFFGPRRQLKQTQTKELQVEATSALSSPLPLPVSPSHTCIDGKTNSAPQVNKPAASHNASTLHQQRRRCHHSYNAAATHR